MFFVTDKKIEEDEPPQRGEPQFFSFFEYKLVFSSRQRKKSILLAGLR
jgi:hypothetical protein